jgi:methanogenic corrinoid protein MtbC1
MVGPFQRDPCDGTFGFETEVMGLPERATIADLVATEITPQLSLLHLEVPRAGEAVVLRSRAEDISIFAQLVLRQDSLGAELQVSDLISSGHSMEQVFLDLFEPTARRLGQMWDNDECDFVDVTRGMGRLQRLLATMVCNSGAPAPIGKRSILMSTIPGEQQHSFGIAIVERLLESWGWQVRCERPGSIDQILDIVENNWIAVVGLSASRTNGQETLAQLISKIRGHSQNSAIGVMVGGPALYDQPGLAATVGADATARNASLAVLAAEKLFKLEDRRRKMTPRRMLPCKSCTHASSRIRCRRSASSRLTCWSEPFRSLTAR